MQHYKMIFYQVQFQTVTFHFLSDKEIIIVFYGTFNSFYHIPFYTPKTLRVIPPPPNGKKLIMYGPN